MLGKLKRPVFGALLFASVVSLIFVTTAAETLEDKVTEFKLKNGMKFLVVERHEAPVAFCAIVFNVGSANEWPNVTGISHLLEHMMFKGTEMMGTKNFKKEIKYLEKTDEMGERSINLRKEIGEWRFEHFKSFYQDVLDTFTDEDRELAGTDKYKQNKLFVEKVRAMPSPPDSLFEIKYLLEDGRNDYLAMYLDYEETWGEIVRLTDEQREHVIPNELWETYMNNGARFQNAGTSYDFTVYFVYLPSNRLELWATMESDRMDRPVFREFWIERDVVMEERRLAENDPDDVLDETFYSVAFSACPYKWSVLGWMSDLRTIDRRELEAYHRKFYAPNNATAVVIGDVDPDKVKKMVKKYFGSIPAQDPPLPVETREPEQQGEKRFVVEHTAEPKLMVGWHKPTSPDPESITFDVIEQILSSGRTSRLYKSIYEDKKLTAEAPRCYTGPAERYDNMMVITAEPKHPTTLEELETAIYEEIEKLKTEPVSDRELQRIKNQIDAQNIRQLGSNLGIAFTLLIGQIYYGDWREIFHIQEMYKDVTKEDIMKAAEKHLTAQHRVVGHRIKKEEEAASGEEMGDDDPRKYQAQLQQYIMSLPEEERMEIIKKFQSMRSEAEAMEYGKELVERAKEAGFIKE